MEKYVIHVEHKYIDHGIVIMDDNDQAKPFVKVIHSDCKMIDGNLRLDAGEGKIRLRFEEKNDNLTNTPRDTTIMWVNAAAPPGVPHFNFRDFVSARVKQHSPHVLIITSCNGAYPLNRMCSDITKMGGRANHFEALASDGTAVACIGTQKGVIAGNGGVAEAHGYEFTYGHIYGFEN